MAYTAVVTHATGDVFPASDWNTYVRDNLAALHGDGGNITLGSAAYTFPGLISTATGFVAAPAAGGTIFTGRHGGDTVGRITADADGVISWGPGGAAAVDTNLYRSNISQLKTDDVFVAAAGFISQVAGGNNAYRNYLLSTDAQPSFSILGTGALSWGPGGASALDASLSRLAAGLLVIGGSAGLGNYIGGGASNNSGGPATLTPDVGRLFNRYNLINASGTFTIAAPTNPPSTVQSAFFFLCIHNASGGAVTLSFNAAYAQALSTPANGLGFIGLYVWNPGTSKWNLVASAGE